MMLVHHFILSYTNPLHTMLEPLSKAYSLGMASGDTESASWSVYGALQIAFQCGRPLVQIEEDSGVYIRQMQQLKREDQLWLTKVLRQVVLNLLGRSRDPTILTGERVDEDEVFERMSRPGFASNLSVCYNWKMVVLTFFGEYEECAKIALARGDRGLETSPGCKFVTQQRLPFTVLTSCFPALTHTILFPFAHPRSMADDRCIHSRNLSLYDGKANGEDSLRSSSKKVLGKD